MGIRNLSPIFGPLFCVCVCVEKKKKKMGPGGKRARLPDERFPGNLCVSFVTDDVIQAENQLREQTTTMKCKQSLSAIIYCINKHIKEQRDDPHFRGK
jgi:hypothetical protein